MGISFFEILNFLGSLGLFLVGMKVMSDSLMELAGNRMRRVMASLTSNRFLAALTGLLVTGSEPLGSVSVESIGPDSTESVPAVVTAGSGSVGGGSVTADSSRTSVVVVSVAAGGMVVGSVDGVLVGTSSTAALDDGMPAMATAASTLRTVTATKTRSLDFMWCRR